MNKTETFHIEKVTVTNAHRTPAELFVAAMAITSGAMTAVGLAILGGKAINFIISII